MRFFRFLTALTLTLSIALAGCGGGTRETQYDRDFKNGIEKYNSGQPMTEGEYRAVQNFKDWQSKQGEKTYDEWDE